MQDDKSDKKCSIFLVESDVDIAQNIEKLLINTALRDHCRIIATDDPDARRDNVIILNEMKAPLRAGALLDRIEAILNHHHTPETLMIGPYTLNPSYHVLTDSEGQSINLTEKESAVLQVLHDAKGRSVTRQDLLDHVWGYARDVETHTLETHIYRLRQKIEDDSSEPRILLTHKDDGYYIKQL